MKNSIKLIALSLALIVVTADAWANSAIYACGHIRRDRLTAIPALKASGYTTAIIFNVTVENDGTLTIDYDWNNRRPAEAGGVICQNGEYVFDAYQPYFINDVKSLLEAPTSISRLEFCIGGWGNGSYGNIKNLVNTYGTGSESILYKNFKALKEAIPEVVAINNDQEQDYDLATATAFHKMLAEIGYKTTIAPYMQKSYWQQLVANLNAEKEVCDLVYLQTYGGGANNNPNDWKVFGNLPMYVGYDNESNDNISSMESKFTAWRDNAGATGGFVWNYNNNNHNLNQWATTINRIFPPVEVEETAATLYINSGFRGKSYTLPAGEFGQGELSLYGIQGKTISSIQLNDGYKITLYTGEAFNGASQTWEESVTNLGTEWLKKACSLKIEANGAGIDTAISSAPYRIEIYTPLGIKVAEAETTLTPEAYIAQSPLPRGLYLAKTPTATTKHHK